VPRTMYACELGNMRFMSQIFNVAVSLVLTTSRNSPTEQHGRTRQILVNFLLCGELGNTSGRWVERLHRAILSV
jgi:hypothetical protein